MSKSLNSNSNTLNLNNLCNIYQHEEYLCHPILHLSSSYGMYISPTIHVLCISPTPFCICPLAMSCKSLPPQFSSVSYPGHLRLSHSTLLLSCSHVRYISPTPFFICPLAMSWASLPPHSLLSPSHVALEE